MIIHMKIHLNYFFLTLKIYYCFLNKFIIILILNFSIPIPNSWDFTTIPIFGDILSYCFYTKK